MSNTNYQFPPSSPLLDTASDDERLGQDPFSLKQKGNLDWSRTSREVNYPTPNPSSALFRSSSPTREQSEEQEEEEELEVKSNNKQPKSVSINSNFNILNPDASVTRLPLLSDKSHFNIGRSSRSCDFALNCQDSRISRIHLTISHNSHEIILTCKGSNGVGIVIPHSCLIYATNSQNNFIISENKSEKLLHQDLVPVNNRTIKLDFNHTEFYIRKNETITMPRFNNVMLQISNQLVLLNPNDIDEELTDDEVPVLLLSTPLKQTQFTVPNTPLKPRPSVELSTVDEDTPSKEPEQVQPQQVEPQQVPVIQHPIPNRQTKPFTIFQDNQETDPERTSNVNTPTPRTLTTTPKSVLTDTTNITKRRAKSEEPESKLNKKKKLHTPTPTPVQPPREFTPVLPENVEEINNILINHLAFSRLNSTPASFLNSFSVITSKLSLSQIRQVLHDIPCIGVIYRQGKDAAGKPLEEEYYYISENDDDPARKEMVANVKGHGGLRSCRRTHKQYYWKKPAPIKK
ncbi:Protein PLM2 [Spathaspora sp. JA1]|nr:Protein PLM2 [Spathaspora sp. JA1]